MGASKANRVAAAADYQQLDGHSALHELVHDHDPREAHVLDVTQATVHGAIDRIATLRERLKGTASWPLADDILHQLERLDARVYELVRLDLRENARHELALATVGPKAKTRESALG